MAKNGGINISITLSTEMKDGIVKAFGPFKDQNEKSSALQKFGNIATTVFSDWITGKKRYRSLTEQYIDWVETIYTELFPQEEVPSTERIYNSLNMPYGQAQYIARVLSAKTLVHWRAQAISELRIALKDQEKNARKYIKDGDQGQGINIQISQVAFHELTRICSSRRRSDRSYVMPQPGASSGDFRFVSVPSCTIVDLIDNSNW